MLPGGGRSTDPHNFHVQKRRQFSNFARNVADADRTVMRRSSRVPVFYKSLCAYGKTVTAVRIADLQDWAWNRFPFRNNESQSIARALRQRKQRHGAVFHRHLHREPAPDFAVIYS